MQSESHYYNKESPPLSFLMVHEVLKNGSSKLYHKAGMQSLSIDPILIQILNRNLAPFLAADEGNDLNSSRLRFGIS